jgi:hypothetical protein
MKITLTNLSRTNKVELRGKEATEFLKNQSDSGVSIEGIFEVLKVIGIVMILTFIISFFINITGVLQ